MFSILVINVGSTSVKTALFHDSRLEASKEIPFTRKSTPGSLAMVSEAVRGFLADAGVLPEALDAIAARGGLLKPLAGGTYLVDDAMRQDLSQSRFGEHPSNLSAMVAQDLARVAGIQAYIVDPVTVDEMEEEAKITGIPSIRRRSIFHALSQKAAARRACHEIGKRYEEASLIVAHMGGGISVAAHRAGKVIDVNNALDGDGPVAPERAGTIPAGDLAKLCFSGQFTPQEVRRMLSGNGGMFAHLNTRDMKAVEPMIQGGDRKAEWLTRAMAYSISKQIGAMAVVLSGRVDATVLTGALASWERLVKLIRERVEFLVPVFVYPENMEMEALAHGVLRVLKGEAQVLRY